MLASSAAAIVEGVQIELQKSTWAFADDEEIVPGRHAVRLLGGGERHEAHLAWDRRLHTLVVAKLLRPAWIDDPRARASLAVEAEALATLAHPGLPRLFAADLAGERPYLVLEHLDGPGLSTAIRRYRPALEQALPLALNLCSVLHYLGGEGWVHLDLKPKNVILGSQPRLIDLGIARRLETVQAVASPIGTDAYMAPEQCDPARLDELCAATDMWGLGVTLFETLERRLPFTRPNPTADPLHERYPQTAGPPAPLSRELPAAVSELVLACLAFGPADRPAPAELAIELERLDAVQPRPRLGRFRPA